MTCSFIYFVCAGLSWLPLHARASIHLKLVIFDNNNFSEFKKNNCISFRLYERYIIFKLKGLLCYLVFLFIEMHDAVIKGQIQTHMNGVRPRKHLQLHLNGKPWSVFGVEKVEIDANAVEFLYNQSFWDCLDIFISIDNILRKIGFSCFRFQLTFEKPHILFYLYTLLCSIRIENV